MSGARKQPAGGGSVLTPLAAGGRWVQIQLPSAAALQSCTCAHLASTSRKNWRGGGREERPRLLWDAVGGAPVDCGSCGWPRAGRQETKWCYTPLRQGPPSGNLTHAPRGLFISSGRRPLHTERMITLVCRTAGQRLGRAGPRGSGQSTQGGDAAGGGAANPLWTERLGLRWSSTLRVPWWPRVTAMATALASTHISLLLCLDDQFRAKCSLFVCCLCPPTLSSRI